MRVLSGVMAAVAAALSVALSPVQATSFQYRTYAQNIAFLKELNATYPELLRVYVAQDKYGLPYPEELTCIGDDKTKELVPCQQFVVHMTNHSTLAAHPDRPQMFFSGALHGNERIGPITTIEMIALVVKFATAYAHPQSPDAAALNSTVTRHTQRWLHHLVNTRDVIITPMTNTYGYSHNVRTELDVDPNRDYNYMRHGGECMQTMTSRVVNEIWRENVFQLAITFHGGMRAISYEWGSPNHYLPSNSHRSQKSPDDAAQAQLATTMAVFAGAFEDETLYPTGTMNDIVYGVTGGMEDWGYAASWENQFVQDEAHKPFKPCKPTTFGGYDVAKTVYNNVTHRAFNILVETSNNKQPEEDTLGQIEDLYNTELDFFSVKNGLPSLGHVSQNVRLALMYMDMVQPYLRWVYASLELQPPTLVDTTELFPAADLYVQDNKQLMSMGCGAYAASPAHVASCNSTKCHVQLEEGKPLKVQVAWEVLGAITVDQTNVQVASDASFAVDGIISESAVQKGTTRRFFDLPDKVSKTEAPDNADTMGTSLFVSCVDLHSQVSKKFYLRAVAVVDQNWRKQARSGDDEPSPHIPPQSHFVNARTNPAWKIDWNGHKVEGSKYWYSPVIEVTVQMNPRASSVESVSTTEPVHAANDSASESPIVASASNNSAAPVTATPMPSTPEVTMTPGPTLDEEAGDDEEEEDDEVATEPEVSSTPSPQPARSEHPETTTVTPLATPSASTTTDSSGPLMTDLKSTSNNKTTNSSLLNYGYLTLGLGGLVITATLTYLYKRVFRSKRRAYVNINRQRPQPSTQVRSARDDEDEDDDGI